MSNRICQNCGEEYSTTYRTCPFCEEERAIKQGHPPHRQGGKRLDKARNSGGAGGVMMLLTVVIIAGALAYVFFGDRIAGTMGIRSDPTELGFVSDQEDSLPAPSSTPPEPEDTAQPEGALTLSQYAITLSAGETALLTVTGGEGEAVWSSSDEQIASVEAGAVTARAAGNATITVVIGEDSAACSVEVQGEPPEPADGAQPSGGGSSGTKLSLNTTDFSIRPGHPAVQMKVSGTSSKVTWASKDPGIASISESGLVTRVSDGTTTITASVDGQVLECIVRCKS